ncbi:MAG: glycosyltransferase family 4 protein [Anaerolineae bacterium]|nr:glycosyltransferase family 4 protein [Anaerolineae bacterium]
MAKSESVNRKYHCMVVHNHYPRGETRVQREAEALLRRNYDVDIICLRGKTEQAVEMVNGARVIRLPVRYKNHKWIGGKFFEYLRFFLLVMVKLVLLYRQRPYNTIQVHNLPDFLVFATWIPKLWGARIILDLHDLMPEFYQARYGSKDKSSLVRWVYLQERLACRFADHVITVSKHWRQSLIERGVPAHKCSVVMNVADDHVFRPLQNDAVKSSDDSGLRMIYHGTLVDRYGLDLAVQAIAQVKDEIPDVHLTILGKGGQVPVLRRLIEELGVGEFVTLRDEMRPVEELPDIIGKANLGVVPYCNDVFTDGLLPTKLMEYAAMGLPAIAARTTAMKTYFSDTMVEFFEPGQVDDLARCIRMLYRHPERMAELREGSKKFNQQYNWPDISAEYVALVERLGSK